MLLPEHWVMWTSVWNHEAASCRPLQTPPLDAAQKASPHPVLHRTAFAALQCVWYYPNAVYVDHDLASSTVFSRGDG